MTPPDIEALRGMVMEQTRCSCGGLKYPPMPHLHAENCPAREQPLMLYREDIAERRMFDDGAANLYEGHPLRAMASALDTWGRMSPGGSYAQQCFIMANECLIADATITALLAAAEKGEGLSHLEVDQRGDVLLYMAWSLKPGQPQIIAVCSSEAVAQRYADVAAQMGGAFYIEPVCLDHAFGRRDMQSEIYRAANKRAAGDDQP